MTRAQLRFFAVIFANADRGDTGYALDFYPEERSRYAWQYRKWIIGEFSTDEEATAAVMAEMQRRSAERRPKLCRHDLDVNAPRGTPPRAGS
jgi:hypothetical protein